MKSSASIPLARNGVPLFRVVLPRGAEPQSEIAGEELRRHLLEIIGAGPHLQREERTRGDAPACRLFIQDRAAAAAAGIPVDSLTLGPEAFHLETRGGNLYVLGGGPRGVLYGVHDLLETLGCRWFTPEIRRLPHDPDLRLPALRKTAAPAFEFRDAFAWDGCDPLWWMRNRMNGWYTPVPACWGGHMDYALFVHTFWTLLPPDEHFDRHPEYFALTGGQRRREHAQLCLSNPDVLKIVTANVLRHMRENPQSRLFSVSQNDCHGYCECPACAAIAAEEGSQSGPVLRFVNAIAAETSKEFPDNLIDTLAYQYTLEAPKHARPHPNVRVRICSIACCQGHGYEDCDHPQSVRFLKALNDWSAITSQIYIWHYCTNFAHYPLPMPDFDELHANLRLYRKKGVYGVFMQGMGEEGGGGESGALRTYVLSRLLWNPDQPVWPIIREFLEGVVGPAAKGVESYLEAFHSRLRKDRSLHPSLYDPPTHPLFDAKTLAAADKGLAEARRKADTPTAKRYVEMLQAGLDYARLWQLGESFRLRGNTYAGPATAAHRRRFGQMVQLWEQEKVQRLQESQPFALSVLKMRQRLEPHRAEWLEDGGQRIAVVPDLGGRLVEWHAAGRQWLMPADPENLWFAYPMNEGYSELVSYGMWHAIGWMEPYRITARTATSITLDTMLTDAIRLRRTYALAKGALTVTTMLTNRGRVAKRLQWGPGLHLRIPKEELEDVVIGFRSKAGDPATLPVGSMPDGLGAAPVLEKEKGPDGEMTVRFRNGIRLVWQFPDEAVIKAIPGRVAAKGLLALDLRTDYTELAPGKSMVMKQVIRITK